MWVNTAVWHFCFFMGAPHLCISLDVVKEVESNQTKSFLTYNLTTSNLLLHSFHSYKAMLSPSLFQWLYINLEYWIGSLEEKQSPLPSYLYICYLLLTPSKQSLYFGSFIYMWFPKGTCFTLLLNRIFSLPWMQSLHLSA